MNIYSITFRGRVKGAIGNFDLFHVKVEAESKEDALRTLHETLYETHEHIQILDLHTAPK